MKSTIIAFIIFLVCAGGAYFIYQYMSDEVEVANEQNEQVNETQTQTPTTTEENNEATSTEETNEPETTIGTSVDDRDIVAYHYGEGDNELLFIGGIHGGYGWNTVLLSYELMDYLEENADAIPENVRVTVIPVMNPDGLNKTIGKDGRFEASDAPKNIDETISGRFNANNVDLNRNFDCQWKAAGTWQKRQVSGGSEAFSEPESQAIRDYIEANDPTAVVVWYSAVGGVFASNCGDGVSEETKTLTNLYADASGYDAYEDFDFYEITGDMVNWLAKENIPAISVLLTTHDSIEWEQNKKGIEALFSHYSEGEEDEE